MSKPISFGLSSKSKSISSTSTPSTSKLGTPKPISFSTNVRKPFGAGPQKLRSSALKDESDEEDDAPPKHEELTGFSSNGAILSKPKEQKTERVIENAGNGDWRKRGKNLLPADVQAAQNGSEVVTVEKDEVSKAYGLQFAEKTDYTETAKQSDENNVLPNCDSAPQHPVKKMTEDERALAALLDDGSGKPKSTATIAVQANDAWQHNETDDFRSDVAGRPESSTLDEYAAMPVEEFGMALLRGMGKKRRANGEVIDLDNTKGREEEKKRKERKQEGFLGIGAKPVKGLEGVELGAWGKADMRKNARGEGFFAPVMLEDKRTGERITEEELERRKKEATREGRNGEEDWRDRRDRNLEKNGRDRDGGEHVNGGSRKRDRDDERGSRSSRRHRDRDDRDYDSSRSRRDRSRSKGRKRNEDRDDEDDRDRERRRDRDRHRDKYRDDDRYDSSSSRRSEQRHTDRDRDRDRDDRRHRDRQ